MNYVEYEKRRNILLELISDPIYRPMRLKDIAVIVGINKEHRNELKELLDSLISDGQIHINADGKYVKGALDDSMVGIYLAHARGFGFVKIDGQDRDYYIAAGDEKHAMHGDKVRISIDANTLGRKSSPEARVISIVEHANETVVGLLKKKKNLYIVIPDDAKINRDIVIEKPDGAKVGTKVVARITNFFHPVYRCAVGQIEEILGMAKDRGVDILSIVKRYGYSEDFPIDAAQEAEGISDDISDEEIAGRRDLRAVQMVTIDSEDAKDLDDAVSLSKTDGLWHLGVHIADVSHYIKEYSALDVEAKRRGTSVYLVDRVLPMLPKSISNGICSLNEGVDRLALSCLMDIDDCGNIVSHEIVESIINVDRRMSYTDVNKIISLDDTDTKEKYASLVDMFLDMKRLSDILRENRADRGYIDFDFPETKVILDDNGKVVDIKPYDRNAATKLIEDFMLAANETVAEEYFWREVPFLYRNHEKPDPEKMRQLATFINNFGFVLRTKAGDVHPKELQKLLHKIEGSDGESVISRITLRSMKRACYADTCDGHFGLAAKYYTHFTSPIRRYPDLQIHRIIKESLHGSLDADKMEYYASILPKVAIDASSMERRADEAERETIKYKQCEYMQSKIGMVYEGVISSVTGFGMYIELPNTIEGLVRMTDLVDDYYVYDETRYELVGSRRGRVYKIGQKLDVCVTGVDRFAGNIDFVPVLNID